MGAALYVVSSSMAPVADMREVRQWFAELPGASPYSAGNLLPWSGADRAVALQVGAALSMVYSSGAPIMFVGCGQTYVDLTKLNVKSIVRSLLR